MTTVAMSGGCIISRRFSDCTDERFRALTNLTRQADISFSHLEGTICAPDEPEAYPAAEAGWTWLRNPTYFAEELRWAGFDLVSHASNHAMDYMYGGLYSTWRALDAAGLPYAGTGRSLTAARRPAYLAADAARVALVSTTPSTPDWARAADPAGDDRARPGINQLRLLRALDPAEATTVKQLAVRSGWWLTEVGDQFMIHPPGLHNTVSRFTVRNRPESPLVADPTDVAANLAAVREARQHADLVIVHIHNHEWEPSGQLSTPPEFVRSLARQCIDAGADIFIAEGAHAMLRGIEIYNGRPIFYDPGDIFKDGNSKTRALSEYYWVQGRRPWSGSQEITTADSGEHDSLAKLPTATHPPGGYNTGRVHGVLLPVCTFNDRGELTQLRIHAATHLDDSPQVHGIPGLVRGDRARRIIQYVGELSAPYGTRIDMEQDSGTVRL